MADQTAVRQRRSITLARLVPLAGVAYCALTLAGDLTIGEFPDASTPPAELSRYYATHADSVRLGGQLMILAALCLGLFGLAVWTRVRDTAGPPMVAGLMLVGTSVAVTAELGGAGAYVLLGSLGADHTVAPAALQAWQAGSQFGGGGGTLFMVGLFAAGVFSRALPAWLSWSALILGIAELTQFGFYASMLALLWTAVAGIVLSVRPLDRAPTSRADLAQPRPA
jgi:hypothetical protein